MKLKWKVFVNEVTKLSGSEMLGGMRTSILYSAFLYFGVGIGEDWGVTAFAIRAIWKHFFRFENVPRFVRFIFRSLRKCNWSLFKVILFNTLFVVHRLKAALWLEFLKCLRLANTCLQTSRYVKPTNNSTPTSEQFVIALI